MKTIPPAVAAVLACALAAGPFPARGQAAPPNLELPEVRVDTIARLAVDGPHAFINRRPAPSGSYVFDGDTVTTGPGTSALLVLNDGGSVQLDQNTDPEFRLLRQGACLLMSILRGQAAIDTKGGCIEFRNQRLNTAGVARSVVNIRVTNREAWVTVIEGSVEMMAPRMAKLGAYDQYSAASNGKSAIRRMTAADAYAAGAWRQRYFRAAQPQGTRRRKRTAAAPPRAHRPAGAAFRRAPARRPIGPHAGASTGSSMPAQPTRMCAALPTPNSGRCAPLGRGRRQLRQRRHQVGEALALDHHVFARQLRGQLAVALDDRLHHRVVL